jgi:hypothetical protein
MYEISYEWFDLNHLNNENRIFQLSFDRFLSFFTFFGFKFSNLFDWYLKNLACNVLKSLKLSTSIFFRLFVFTHDFERAKMVMYVKTILAAMCQRWDLNP